MTVLILGAGPAGSSCSIQLLKAGHTVTLLDRQSFPRHAPGETLHPGVEPLLKQLDVFERVQNQYYIKHSGIILQNNICEKVFEHYNKEQNWQGYQLYRENFDNILLNKAISLGAEFFSGISINEIEINTKACITQICTSKGKFKADFFIDATGKNSFLAKKLKVNYSCDSLGLIAYYGYIVDNSQEISQFGNPLMVWDNKGWTWISKVKDNLLNWNRLCLVEERLPLKWIPPELEGYKVASNRKAVDVTWRIANHVSKSNYFFIGDAAFVLDPASSHGVLKAIMSGMMVAYLISKLKAFNIKYIHQYYNAWVYNWYEQDKNRLKSLYVNNNLNFWK